MAAASLGAFDLEVIVEPSKLPSEVKICCIEKCGSQLYVGTQTGLLINFEVHPQQEHPVTVHKLTKPLGPKAPVSFIRYASALERLMVLCDGNLGILSAPDMASLPLSGSEKFKAVTACCVNENPKTDDPFCVQMCLGKKKQLVVIKITEENVSVDKIREVASPVQMVCMDGDYVCAALSTHYMIYNIKSGGCQDLFPFESGCSPIMTRIAKEEFLLDAPGCLGMFVTVHGISARPPIPWAQPVRQFVFCNPYVIALTLSDQAISVYSALDQKSKQTLTFSGAVAIGNFDGELLVASHSCIYRIRPVSIQLQIEYLLENERVEEALQLAECSALDTTGTAAHLEDLLARVRVRAAFLSLQHWELAKSRELLLRSRVDPRELLCLYPRLLPATSNFTRSPYLADVADITQLTRNEEAKLAEVEAFFVDYLESFRAMEGEHYPYKKEVDTALIKLYAKSYPVKLAIYIRTQEMACEMDECALHLDKYSRYHALALLRQRQGDYIEAFTLWQSLLTKERQDSQFPGHDFFFNALIHGPLDSMLRFAAFFLQKDQVKGVGLFTLRPHGLEDGQIDRVLHFLQPFNLAYRLFLEYLVWERKSQLEHHHTELATAYLNAIMEYHEQEKTQSQAEGCEHLQRQFQTLILTSDVVRPHYLLSRLQKTNTEALNREKAILYGKMGEHEKALQILAHKFLDFAAAEDYCDKVTQVSLKKREQLLTTLLRVYLDPQMSRNDDIFSMAALDLINRRAANMNGQDVLSALPDHWSLSALYPALSTLLQSSLHKHHQASIKKNLSVVENVNLHWDHYQLTKHPILIKESSYCMLCKKNLDQQPFVRYPNGVIIHTDCMTDPHICPVTGHIFSLRGR